MSDYIFRGAVSIPMWFPLVVGGAPWWVYVPVIWTSYVVAVVLSLLVEQRVQARRFAEAMGGETWPGKGMSTD